MVNLTRRNVKGYIFIGRDITDQKVAQQKLKNAYNKLEELVAERTKELNDSIVQLAISKEKAEESSRLKSAFLNNLSHEVRTPLTAICGFSSRLTNPKLTEEKRLNFASIIEISSNQLLSVISDILTISSLEAKQEKLHINKVSINGILMNLLSTFRRQHTNLKVQLYKKQSLNDKNSEIFTDEKKS